MLTKKTTKKAKRKAAGAVTSARTARRTKATEKFTSNTPRAREQALRELEGTLRAIPKTQLLTLRADSSAVGQRALEQLRHIAPYLPRIAKLPEVNHFWVNNLEKIALALLAVSANKPDPQRVRSDIAAAYQTGFELKGFLRDCVKVLIRSQVLPADALDTVEASRAYTGTGKELTALARLLTRHAAAIRGKTPITSEDVTQAVTLGKLLTKQGDARYQLTESEEDAALLHQQAYTLLVLAYSEVQRCIRFLDAEAEPRVVPTLFPRRGRKKVSEHVVEPRLADELPFRVKGSGPAGGRPRAVTR